MTDSILEAYNLLLLRVIVLDKYNELVYPWCNELLRRYKEQVLVIEATDKVHFKSSSYRCIKRVKSNHRFGREKWGKKGHAIIQQGSA